MVRFADGAIVRAPSLAVWWKTRSSAFGEKGSFAESRRHREWRTFGWLDPSAEFRTGPCPEPAVRRLVEAAKTPVQRTRGFHLCEFCEEREPMGTTYPTGDGGKLLLGSACLEVFDGEGNVWIAPNLVLHYIDSHRYLPPDPILEVFEVRD